MDVSTENLTTHDILSILQDPDKSENDSFIKNVIKPIQRNSDRSPGTKIIKPNNFYGNSLSNDESIFKVKRLFGTSINPKIKTRLFVDLKSNPKVKKRLNSVYSKKIQKRKEIFTGVGHSLKPKPRIQPLTAIENKQTVAKAVQLEENRARSSKSKTKVDIDNVLDIYKIQTLKKQKGSPYIALKFTKPDRKYLENEPSSQRKIFKSTISSPGRAYFDVDHVSNYGFPKKRKLLNPNDTVLLNSELVSASDFSELILDGKEIENQENECKDTIDNAIRSLEGDVTKSGSKHSNDIFSTASGVNESVQLSNLPLSECTNTNLFEEWDNISPKYQTPDKMTKVLTPTKRKSYILQKEDLENTPQQKLFPVFGKLMFNGGNASGEKLRTYSSGKKWRPMGNDQYQIDAGQKRFGASQCSTCGVVYQLGDPDDERDHEKYHRNHKLFRHNGWSRENVVGQYGLERVILVMKENKSWWNKTLSILKVVDEELGYTTEDELVLTGLKVYLYIDAKQVTGCLVATQISHASKIMSDEAGIDLMSDESYSVKCGISRLWTHPLHRRKGIASRLVDTMRKSFFYGYCLKMDEFAFSAPTQDGKGFAAKYTKVPNYLIYTGW